MPDTKVCTKCHIEKSIEEFYRHGTNKDGHAGACKTCTLARTSAYTKAHPEIRNKSIRMWRHRHPERVKRYKSQGYRPERVRAYGLRKNYGLSVSDYDNMFAQQDGICAICGLPPEGGKHLVVDHDHDTGVNRGLLCNRCNLSIGAFNHNPVLLENAVGYLREHGR